MSNKYSKLAINLNCTSVYTFFIKIFYFFFSKKPRYNWYNSKKIDIPTLNRSKLYLRAWYNKGTIGTIVQKASNTNDLRGARVYFYIIYFYFVNLGVYRGDDPK